MLGRELKRAAEVSGLTGRIRGHLMARGGLEVAVWDLEARLASYEMAAKMQLAAPQVARLSDESAATRPPSVRSAGSRCLAAPQQSAAPP